MSAPLKSFIERFLPRHGALVEDVGGDTLEVLLPPELAEHLGLAELEHLSFPDVSQEPAAPAAMPDLEGTSRRIVSYQSELLDTLGRLLVGNGAVAAAALAEPLSVKQLDLERDIERAMTLQNAVLRSHRQEPAVVPYLIVHCKYTALSDERREGMASLAIDERTLNVVDGIAELISELSLTTELPDDVRAAEFDPVYARACGAAQSLIQGVLAEFIKSTNRRLNRDVQRVTDYYRTIQQEIEANLKKRNLSAEEREREQSRIRATEIELERKIHDLQAKYDLTIRVEVVGVLRLFVPVTLLSLTVMRRKWTVPLELAWNPLLRELERPTCVGCYRPSKTIFICDEQRHIVCPECFSPCQACQHSWCRACTPRGCPRCQKGT
jgi:hypothetical protein